MTSLSNATLWTIVCVLTLSTASMTQVQHAKTEIVLCGDMVPEELNGANATFQVLYELQTDDAGRVRRVRKVRNEFLPEAPLVACLMRWNLPATGAKVDVAFQWQHARGWTAVTITLPNGDTRRITADPGWQ